MPRRRVASLPHALQRPCHQTVLRLDRIIFAREAEGIAADDQTGIPQSDLGDQLLRPIRSMVPAAHFAKPGQSFR
ncbi:hypothetical protein X769_31780 [Mesorhizobium sp. LSJC268A00]|nr:hypothetical protein X769_31780 [Mesorhizobium sp. LSJC268A00]